MRLIRSKIIVLLKQIKNKKIFWGIVFVFVFILLSNIFLPVRWIVGFILPKEKQKSIAGIWLYTTKHGEFKRGQDGLFIFSNSYERVVNDFTDYKRCHPTSPDTVLYRTFKLDPWQFWNWIDYYTNPRWKYPYLSPAEIEPKLHPSPQCICSDYSMGPAYY